MVHHLAHPPTGFCQISSSLRRIGQTQNQSQSKPRSTSRWGTLHWNLTARPCSRANDFLCVSPSIASTSGGDAASVTIRVRQLNLGWCFFALKVAFSWPSVDIFSKKIWGLMSEVKSVPNFCSFCPESGDTQHLKGKNANLNYNAGLW